MATAAIPPQAALVADVRADVCVVGAGMAGMTTAYLLAREGLSVVVLDDGPVAGGQTQRTTAHLANAIDDRYTEIERLHGAEGARLAADSHTAAIAFIDGAVREEAIDCDFGRLDGYLFLPPGECRDVLDRELGGRTPRRAG
jgi:glycine/D-amino acid oxidase-like deaminating enzyme